MRRWAADAECCLADRNHRVLGGPFSRNLAHFFEGERRSQVLQHEGTLGSDAPSAGFLDERRSLRLPFARPWAAPSPVAGPPRG